MPVVRTQRDEAVLEALVFKVRLLTVPLAANAWWGGASSAVTTARRRLQHLTNERLIEQTHVLAEPMLALTAPLFCWRPGAAGPDCDALGYALQTRWGDAPPKRVRVYVASKKAVYQYGGRGAASTVAGHARPPSIGRLCSLPALRS